VADFLQPFASGSRPQVVPVPVPSAQPWLAWTLAEEPSEHARGARVRPRRVRAYDRCREQSDLRPDSHGHQRS
jgi:hypothetical protein